MQNSYKTSFAKILEIEKMKVFGEIRNRNYRYFGIFDPSTEGGQLNLSDLPHIDQLVQAVMNSDSPTEISMCEDALVEGNYYPDSRYEMVFNPLTFEWVIYDSGEPIFQLS